MSTIQIAYIIHYIGLPGCPLPTLVAKRQAISQHMALIAPPSLANAFPRRVMSGMMCVEVQSNFSSGTLMVSHVLFIERDE